MFGPLPVAKRPRIVEGPHFLNPHGRENPGPESNSADFVVEHHGLAALSAFR
jgi:hypothetical protein